MTIRSATDCPMCGETMPPGRNLYCAARCRERAKKQRQRARKAGDEVAAPLAQRRRYVADELAERLASGRARGDLAQRDELVTAQREVARLGAQLAAQQREGSRSPAASAGSAWLARVLTGGSLSCARLRPHGRSARHLREGSGGYPYPHFYLDPRGGESVALNVTRT